MSVSVAESRGNGRLNIILIAIAFIAAAVIGAILMPVKLEPVELSGAPVFAIGGFNIYNTWLSAWLTIIAWLAVFGLATRNMKLVPTGLQNLCEAIIEVLYGFAINLAGEKKGRQMFTLFSTIFLFVLLNNWQELLPGFTNGTLWVHGPDGQVPLFRAASADLNTTLALALISVIFTQAFSIKSIGFSSWGSRYLNLKGGFMGIYVGLLEVIGEVAHVISFSFRLFGNIFAGDVLLSVIPFLIPIGVVLPFLFMEMFVGVIQAFIFASLTMVFTAMASVSHADHGGEHADEAHH